MKVIRLSLVIFSCFFLLTAAYAAPPAKIPNLVGSWAITAYADGRIYVYPHSCLVITSQNGNLLEGTYYWHSSMKVITQGTGCYDSNDPLSCPAGTVHEFFSTTPASAEFSGSINANQVILQGQASETFGSNVFDISQTFTGLYDQASDSANGMAHVSVVRKTDGILDVVSIETRGHVIHSRGTICPMTADPAPMTWVGHEY